jgi:hypothetical protein
MSVNNAHWLPAQPLDEILRVFRDFPGEIDGVDSLQDDVVRLHGIIPGEGRAEARNRQQFYNSRTHLYVSVQIHILITKRMI